MVAADFKLTDLLSVAGATIGIIIAAAIMLQCLITKQTAKLQLFRQLTHEYRSNQFSDERRDGLRKQITNYNRQVTFLNHGMLLISAAILLFILTVASASLSVIFPQVVVIRTVGSTMLFIGLALIAAAVVLQVLEVFFSRDTVAKEIGDLANLPSAGEALR